MRSLPAPAGSDSLSKIYPLGALEGFPIYAMRRLRESGPLPGDVCLSSEVIPKAPRSAMTEERARALLRQAVQVLDTRCGGQIAFGRVNPRLRDHLSGQWVDDALFAQLLADQTYDEYKPLLRISGLLFGQAAQRQQAEQQALLAHAEPLLKANEERLKALFAQHRIQAWVPLDDLADNPFRWQGQTLLAAARLSRALSADAVLALQPRRFTAGGPGVVLTDARAADWGSGGYLVVIRPTGRYKGEESNPAAAQLIDKIPCRENDCLDLLWLPANPPVNP